MPNYCDNYVTFKNTDKSKIDELEAVLSPDGDGCIFNTIRPIPLEEEDNSYDWHIQNWGTKWEATIYDFSRDEDNEIGISFESAWCPPIALYEWMVENEWEIDAFYSEAGQGFAGNFCKEDDCYEYDLSERETWEDIPDDIKEFANLESDYEWMKETWEEE